MFNSCACGMGRGSGCIPGGVGRKVNAGKLTSGGSGGSGVLLNGFATGCGGSFKGRCVSMLNLTRVRSCRCDKFNSGTHCFTAGFFNFGGLVTKTSVGRKSTASCTGNGGLISFVKHFGCSCTSGCVTAVGVHNSNSSGLKTGGG